MTGLGIGEVSGRLGVAIDTLRYYERAGIVPAPARDGGGRRVYAEDDLHLLGVLLCLRRTGMPVRDVARFTELVRLDPEGVPARLELLLAHRERVRALQRELEDGMVVLDGKIADYQGRLDGDPAAALGQPGSHRTASR